MINLSNIELTVYEVDVTVWDKDLGDYVDCESEYVVVDPREDTPMNDIISSVVGNMSLDNCRVLVYEARYADFTTMLHKSGEIEFDATGDIDTSTGYSGSPIHEVYYNELGEVFTPE